MDTTTTREVAIYPSLPGFHAYVTRVASVQEAVNLAARAPGVGRCSFDPEDIIEVKTAAIQRAEYAEWLAAKTARSIAEDERASGANQKQAAADLLERKAANL